MSRFCRFSKKYELPEICNTEELAGEYLDSLGYKVYFLLEQRGMWIASFVPYIFVHEQIQALLAAVNNTKSADDRRNIQNSLPVIFRKLYGCGLRVSEVLKLQTKDVNLADGILTIKEAKMDRNRLIPLQASAVNMQIKSGGQGYGLFLYGI